MEIPEAIRVALKSAGLSPSDWKRVRDAFDSLGDPGTVSDEQIRDLLSASDRLYEAERAMLARSIPFNLELEWDRLNEILFRALWTLWGHEGALQFGNRFKMPKTTVYRKLRALGIPTRMLPVPKHLPETPAEVNAEIARLREKLVALEMRRSAMDAATVGGAL